MNKQLALAYAWGKWIALRREEYEKAMDFYKSQRPRKNWAILVDNDEMALRYQRCTFRVRRAMRAVGAWGMIGHASLMEGDGVVTIAGVQFPAKVATPDELAVMNANSFQKDRVRVQAAKQSTEDKRHPLAAYQDHCAEEDARAYEAELMSMRY